MAKKIYASDPLSLGIFSYPILEFNERMETAKITNPQLTDSNQRAALVYFGMLAEQPKPTRDGAGLYVDWGTVPKEGWLKYEEEAKYKPLGFMVLSSNYVKEADDAQTAYFYQLKNLQSWLAYFGLAEGIQKTLNEQSRKRQADLAAIAASNAAAARALVFSQVTEDMTEEARLDAAKAEARANKTLEQNLEKEAEIKQELEDIEKGYLKQQSTSTIWPWLFLGAGVFYAFGKSNGKKRR